MIIKRNPEYPATLTTKAKDTVIMIPPTTNKAKEGLNNIEAMTKLGTYFRPGPFDVICARGKSAKLHCGNTQFRQKIEESREAYAQAGSRLYKSLVVSSVVDWVRVASPNGGFVKEIDGIWYEVGDHLAREKVGQSLREQLHSQYKSSARSKRQRRKIQEKEQENEVQSVHRVLDCMVRSNTSIAKTMEQCKVVEEDASDEMILDFFTKKNSFVLNTIMYDPKLQNGILQLALMSC